MMESLNINQLSETYLIPWGVKILYAVMILILGFIVKNIVIKLLSKVLKSKKVDDILVDFIKSIVKTLIIAFAVIAAIDQLGIETTSVVAILGAATLAISLALQSSLQNFASGVMLIFFRPFKSGDFVAAGGVTGVVESVSVFNTTMRTPDNKEVIVPNGSIYGGVITNYSARPTRRVDLVFGIGYGDDIKKAKKLLEKIVNEHPKILKDPVPLVVVSELAESSVNFNVRPWVKSEDYWSVYFELTETVKLKFDENGISIPFPQMDVHLDKTN